MRRPTAVFLLILLTAYVLAAQRIRTGPADVSVDAKRVDLIQVPDEKPVNALVFHGVGSAQRLFGLSGDTLFTLEAAKTRVVGKLPGPAATLVSLPGDRLLAGPYLVDLSGRVIRDYGVKGIQAAVADRQGRAYVVNYPDGEFFVLGERAESKGRVYKLFQIGVDEYFRPVPRALAVDRDGVVWTSGELGYIYRYADERLEKTVLRLPAEKGRQFLNVVDAMANDPSGVIYGGTSDGYLFRLDPRKPTIENLGKPVGRPRIRALALQADASMLGVAADQLFTWRNGSFELLGLLEYRQPEKTAWLAYEIDSLAIAADGTAYLGESEYRAHLFVLRK